MNHKPTHSGADDFPNSPLPFRSWNLERGLGLGTRNLQGSLPDVEMTPWGAVPGRTWDWELVTWGF